jgi:hypothetical protein
MNEKQQQAILLLATGKTGSEVADQLKVTPKTISVWKSAPEFESALNKHLLDIKMAHSERLRHLCGLALETIEDCLHDEDLATKEKLSACFKILELAKVRPSEIGETDVGNLAFFDNIRKASAN